jgi:uncharacterized membrane protein YfcA
MYFPTAAIECHPLLPLFVSFGISFFTSMGGISGAFLLLPFQMSVLGYVNPSVSATNQFFNIIACPSGVLAYWREGRLVWPLAATVAIGTLPGTLLGALIRINCLPDPAKFKIFAGLLLLYVGGRMLWDFRSRQKKGRSSNASQERRHDTDCRTLGWNLRRITLCFQKNEYVISSPALVALSLTVGLLGGIYGVGGGVIMAPFLVSFFRLPVYIVAGATLLATFLTSLAGVTFYALLAPLYPSLSVAPDWRLGILLGLGGMCGMYLGARCQKYVPAGVLKVFLAAVLLFLALAYLTNIL